MSFQHVSSENIAEIVVLVLQDIRKLYRQWEKNGVHIVEKVVRHGICWVETRSNVVHCLYLRYSVRLLLEKSHPFLSAVWGCGDVICIGEPLYMVACRCLDGHLKLKRSPCFRTVTFSSVSFPCALSHGSPPSLPPPPPHLPHPTPTPSSLSLCFVWGIFFRRGCLNIFCQQNGPYREPLPPPPPPPHHPLPSPWGHSSPSELIEWVWICILEVYREPCLHQEPCILYL